MTKLRGLVGNLQSSLDAVDPSVTARTSGNFVTEGQRQALVNRERQPILGDLGKQEYAMGQEQQGYGLAASLAGDLAHAMMAQDNQKYQSLLDRYNASAAYEREQESMRLEREKMASAERSAKAGAGGAGGYDLGGGGATTPSKAGKFIGKDDFRGRLAWEASRGNGDAKIALKYSGNTGRYDGVVSNLAEYNALRRIGIQGNYHVPGLSFGTGLSH